MNSDWVPARDALKRDTAASGQNIVQFAADGLIRSRASAFFLGHGKAPERDVDLPASFWHTMRRMTGSAYRDWRPGAFSTAIPHHLTKIMPREAERAIGVVFAQSDLDALLPATATVAADQSEASQATSTPPAPKKRAGGAPPKMKEWHRLYAHAIKMAYDGDIDDMKSIADLRRALLRAVDDEIGEDSVDPVASKIWHVIREGAAIDPPPVEDDRKPKG